MKAEREKAWEIEKLKSNIRHEYGVLVPTKKDLQKVKEDMHREAGLPIPGRLLSRFTVSETLAYWRRNRARYEPGVPEGQEDREEREYWRRKMEMDREEARRRQERGKEPAQE